jgi:site-specific DNA-cytosine methylase
LYLTNEQLEKVKYLKWAKTIPRVKNWHEYTYREWAIPFPDDIEKPSRTILTSEWNISRTSHYIIQKVWDRDKDNRWIRTDKSYTLPANPMSDRWQMVVENTRIRKLTPIECERLQTLPDNYTEWVSNSQRYKMLWNGRTVDVLAHIFRFINLFR